MSPAAARPRSRAARLRLLLRFLLITLAAMAIGAFLTWRITSYLG
ncbi:MAG TPA: hypothetical protein VES01_05445 [Dermatophilaceae bacterium]|nr:hypothetical protein [Dermatophilaceae bacterium]